MIKKTASQINCNGIILWAVVMLLFLLFAFSSNVIAQTSLSRVSLVNGNWAQTINRNYWQVEFWECPQELRCLPQMCENHTNGINEETQYVFTGMNGSNFSFNYNGTTTGSYSSTVYEWGGTVGICCVDSEVNPVNNSGSGTSEQTGIVLNTGTYRRTVFPYGDPPEFDLRYDECGLPTPDPNTPSGYITQTGESSYSIKLDCSPEESERTISHIHIESTHMRINGDSPPSGNELLINGIAPSYSQQSSGGYNNYERYYSWSGFLKWDIPVDQRCGSTVTLSPTSSLHAYAPIASITAVLSGDPLIGDEQKEAGEPECENAQGDPVDAVSGNKYESVTDLTISTPGIPLEFKRYYNSVMSVDDSLLGYGWTHNYNMSAKIVGTTPTIRVRAVNADGKALYFSQISQTYPDGTHFYGEAGVKDKLIINTSGQFILRKKDTNLTYTFDTEAAGGKLLSISDPYGNIQNLTYTGTQLMQVSDNFGKAITFVYETNYIKSVTDPKAQAVVYTCTDGDLTHVVYPDTNSLSYTYDMRHRLTDRYDTTNNLTGHWEYLNGRVSNHYRYLKDGVPQEQILFDYNYTSTPNTTTVTKSTGTTTYKTRVYNGRRETIGIDGCGLSCGGISTSFAYNQWNDRTMVSQMSSGYTYSTYYTYDGSDGPHGHIGEITSMTEAPGLYGARTTNYIYNHRSDDPFLLIDSTETKASVVYPAGQNKTITTTYGAGGKVSSRIETGYVLVNGSPSVRTYTTSYQYNSYGQLTQINGHRASNITTFSYYTDPDINQGQLYRITNALGQITELSGYDANGNVGFIKDPNGVITSLDYDARNRLKRVTNPDTSYTEYTYDGRGNISRIKLPENNYIDYTYNLADKITQISDTLGNKIQYTYDVEGNKTGEEIHDPSNNLKKYLDYTYDEYNRLTKIINPPNPPGNDYTQYGYDNRNNRTIVIDPRNNVTEFRYDTLSRRSSMIQPGNITTTYGYDTQDNLTSVQDPKYNITQYTYDDFGRKVKTISPDTRTTTNVYDEAGNLTQSTDAKGIVVNYAYDALNRITAIQFPADPNQNVTFTYDSTSVTNGKGRLTGRSDPSGTYTFYYDAQGNLTREDKTVSNVSYTTQYTYNKNNALTSIAYPSGRVVNYVLDQVQRIHNVTMTKNSVTTPLASSINYEPFGGVKSLIYGNGLTLSQGYDNQYRISSIITGSAINFSYGYDANDNVTSIIDAITPPTANVSGIPGTYSYPTTSNKLSDITGPPAVTYTHDLNGNITSQITPQNTRIFVYDLSNQITSITDNGTQIAAYTYNGLKQRTKKVVGSDTTIYHYDLMGHLIAETNAAGQTLVEYLYLGDQPLAMIRPTEQVYHYHNDHLGTPQVMTSSTGTVVWKAAYNAFGNATVDPSSTITNNIRFPGQYYDTETGLHYNWNRYYDPMTGRYITADPIGLEGGVNLFGYVANDPVNFIDPEGLFLWIPALTRGGGKGILSAGPGALVGGIAGAYGGAALGALTGVPFVAIAGGIAGGMIGSKIGGLFDSPCAGQLNCGEDEEIKRRNNACK